MVDVSPTFLTGMQFKLLEQELQEHLGRAYYLLVAQEVNYVNHTLSVETLVSKLQVIASRVKAFHHSKDTSSPTALVSDTKVTQKNSEKTKGDALIVNDKDGSFFYKENQPHQYRAIEQEMIIFNIQKQDSCQNEDCSFKEEERRNDTLGEAPMHTFDSHAMLPFPSTSFYSCPAMSCCADIHIPTLVMEGVHDGSINEGNNTTKAFVTEVSLTVPYPSTGNETQPVEGHQHVRQKYHQYPSTVPFIETIESLLAVGNECGEVGDSHVVSVGDSTSLTYSLVNKNKHRQAQSTLLDPPFSNPVNQLEGAEGGITNTVDVSFPLHHKHYDRPQGVFDNAPSCENIAISSSTEVLHSQHAEKDGLLSKDAESCRNRKKDCVSVDQVYQARIEDLSQQSRHFFINNKCDSMVLAPFAAPEVWHHADRGNQPFKGVVMHAPQGYAGPFLFATTSPTTQGKEAIPTHWESRHSFRPDSKVASEANQGKLSISGVNPQFVFWPGLQMSNLFLPIVVAARLDGGTSDVALGPSLTLPLREKDLKAILEARFPPYLTQLTPGRVYTFHNALRESLLMVRTLPSGGFSSVSAPQEEEEGWAGRCLDLWRQAAEVAATLLTLLPPVLQALQGAASIPLDIFSTFDGVFSEAMNATNEAGRGFCHCLDVRGSPYVGMGGPSGLQKGGVRCWRRYWCRRLYELLHETLCGFEVVCELDAHWPRALHRLMEQRHQNMEYERSSSGVFHFPIPTPSPFSDSKVSIALNPGSTCMATAVQISGFDSESCRVFLHDLASPDCFPSLLSALTEDGDDDGGCTSETSHSNSGSQMIYIEAELSVLEDIPPSCPGSPLPIAHDSDPKNQSVVIKVQMPPCVVVERLQRDLVYLDSLI